MVIVQVIVGGLLLGAIYALFSSGLTLIWGMMNFINFAHGEFVMLGMYVALLVVVWLGGGPAIFGIAAALALFVLGVGIYFGAHPPRHARADAGANSLDLRSGAVAALHRVLDFLGEFRLAAAELARRHAEIRRHLSSGRAACRRRRRRRADDRAASFAHPHDGRQQASGRGRRSRRGDADGHQARSHAGAGLGSFGGRRRHCRRA